MNHVVIASAILAACHGPRVRGIDIDPIVDLAWMCVPGSGKDSRRLAERAPRQP
jgi:hypothetical protein